MHWISRAVLSLLVGSIVAAAAQTFQGLLATPRVWISVGVGIAAAAYSFFKALLDLNKVILENQKLRYEVKSLEAAEKERQTLVRPPTPEERELYPSPAERKLRAYWKVQENRDRLSAQSFIARSFEEKT
jgi:hypothetical protein